MTTALTMGLRRSAREYTGIRTTECHQAEIPHTPDAIVASIDVTTYHQSESGTTTETELVCVWDEDGNQRAPTVVEKRAIEAWLRSDAGRRWESDIGRETVDAELARAEMGPESW